MSFRGRLLAGFLVAVLLPLGVLALGVRSEMQDRMLAEGDRRARELAEIIVSDLAEAHAAVGADVAAVAASLPDDPRFRSEALRGDGEGQAYVRGFAERVMRSAGLSMLQVRDDSARVLSSGHFPSEFGRVDRELPALLASVARPTLLGVRTATGSLLVIARIDSISIAGRRFTVIGGRAVDQGFLDRLARDDGMTIVLETPRDTLRAGGLPGQEEAGSSPGGVVRRTEIPFVDASTADPVRGDAEMTITHSLSEADAVRRGIDRWILAALVLATLGAVLVSTWLARRLSRPIEELAQATTRVDLDHLDVGFATGRSDEIGTLSRRMAAMVERLRGSTALMREAERRAAVGDIARQVNHDIKNGLAPIRNVIRHLIQVGRDEPSELPAVFAARQGTLESSIGYLETLALNYARLSPALGTQPCDANAVVAEVVAQTAGRGNATVRARPTSEIGAPQADAVVLRRILENLVSNAVDSLVGKPGEVTVGTEPIADARGQAMVRISVSDTGRGMSDRELARAFDDFHTTKPNGTGLGLSVVRRLVADLGGVLRVETEPGRGTRITVDLPVARPAQPRSPVAAS